MTIREYYIDGSDNEIFITVTVSTPGVARSKATITLPSGVNKKIAETTDGTGMIRKIPLGKGSELHGSLVEIDTDISLKGVPEQDWPSCFSNLNIRYYFEGGYDGQEQPFKCEDDDKEKTDSGKTIVVEKYTMILKK